MDHPSSPAQGLARLVWLLLREPQNTDEQAAALHALVAGASSSGATLSVRDGRLASDGIIVSGGGPETDDLAARMVAHGVREVRVDAGCGSTDLLDAARILASPRESRAAASRLNALGSEGVRFLQDSRATPSFAGPAMTLAEGDPRSNASGSIMHDGGAGSWMQFAAAQLPTATPKELLDRLRENLGLNTLTRVLDSLVTLAEHAGRDGKPHAVAEVFHGIVKRESEIVAPGAKGAYDLAVRRLTRPALLRSVVLTLARDPEREDEYVSVLLRTGEEGAEALIEQLTHADTTAHRRSYFDALLRLQAGVPTLIHMLGDARWFVVRNAAELLGKMKAAEAETALVGLLGHPDERVRRATAAALMRLDTQTAAAAVSESMVDESPEVRVHAVTAIAARKDGSSAGTLTRALDDEGHADVQLAILAALGKIATREAVQKLIRAAEPEGLLSRKKPTAFRVAAVRALAEARTPVAMVALSALEGDRDPEVRDAAAHALARATRINAP